MISHFIFIAKALRISRHKNTRAINSLLAHTFHLLIRWNNFDSIPTSKLEEHNPNFSLITIARRVKFVFIVKCLEERRDVSFTQLTNSSHNFHNVYETFLIIFKKIMRRSEAEVYCLAVVSRNIILRWKTKTRELKVLFARWKIVKKIIFKAEKFLSEKPEIFLTNISRLWVVGVEVFIRQFVNRIISE